MRCAPVDDGTTIYDDDKNPLAVKFYSKVQPYGGIWLNSDSAHSRNLFENFGEGESR
jgi:hypothetical protein